MNAHGRSGSARRRSRLVSVEELAVMLAAPAEKIRDLTSSDQVPYARHPVTGEVRLPLQSVLHALSVNPAVLD